MNKTNTYIDNKKNHIRFHISEQVKEEDILNDSSLRFNTVRQKYITDIDFFCVL